MRGPKDVPYAVTGERCAIVEKPPKGRTEGGLIIPDIAKMRYFAGRLIDAGLQARDKLYDHGYELGDEVTFGQYAGLREAWDHVVEGDHTLPDDCYKWSRDVEASSSVCERYICEKTGAIRLIESLIIVNVDDLLASIQLAERLRSGQMRIVRKKYETPSGERVYHAIERAE